MYGYVFDLVAAAILVGALFVGRRRGFVKEVFDLIALVVAICAVGACEHLGIRLFHLPDKGELLSHLLSVLVVFGITLVIVRTLGFVVQKVAELNPLKTVGRLLGGVTAVVKAWIGLGFALVLLVRFPVLGVEWIRQSILSPVLLFAGRIVAVVLPRHFADAIRDLLA